jgi:hypothetical protein
LLAPIRRLRVNILQRFSEKSRTNPEFAAVDDKELLLELGSRVALIGQRVTVHLVAYEHREGVFRVVRIVGRRVEVVFRVEWHQSDFC